MTLKGKFVQEDALRNRKRLGPLGWIAVFIVILFVLACGLGWYALLTRNVSRLPTSPTASATATVAKVAVTSSSITVTPTVAASKLITWTVTPTKNANGQTIYDGPPEIKAWVMRDYQAAQKWKMGHLFEKDFLLAHLAEYYSLTLRTWLATGCKMQAWIPFLTSIATTSSAHLDKRRPQG